MASTTIKVTYALDPETVKLLESMARRLGVSKSQALRRAIRSAARVRGDATASLSALDRLQAAAARVPVERWAAAVRKRTCRPNWHNAWGRIGRSMRGRRLAVETIDDHHPARERNAAHDFYQEERQ